VFAGRSNDEADGFNHRHNSRINRHHAAASANANMSTGSPTFIANANNELDNTLHVR
jgi:hypothetical protein